MFRMTAYLAAPAVVFLMGSTATFALTADQVWQSWKDAATLAGLEVKAATENNDGGVLTLNGVTVAPAGVPGISISDMVLTEVADGSVEIVPGADINLDLSGETKGTSKVVHEGLTIVARDADGGVAYDFTADKLDVVYDTTYPGMSFDGTAAPEVKSAGTVGFANMTGSYSDTPGTNRIFGLSIVADTLAYSTSLDDPSLELKQATTSATQGIELGFTFALPTTISLASIMEPKDFGTALQEGLSVSFTSKQGTSAGTMNQESPYFAMNMAINAGAGEAAGSFDKNAFKINSTGESIDIEGSSAMLPSPVKVTSGPIELAINSPIMSADTSADFGFLMKLSQLSINEEAWAMFDPTGAFPRDAADLAIDVSGKTKMDVIAMMQADETGGMPVMPAPDNLDITELTLKVAGAALAGTGAFTFDNSMGMPMPLGEANVSVTGANALIDGLIATGLMAEEDAMGARMMMGAFMSPGAGPDELTSKIEAKAGFEIYVNGQRVQ